MTLITLYARREPTTDAAAKEMRRFDPKAFAGAQDVQLYRDREATQPAGRYLHDYSNKPKPRRRVSAKPQTVQLNCCTYAVEWLPDLDSLTDGATNILARTDRLGLRAISYTNRATLAHHNVEGRAYWIPRDAVATDGRAGIFHRISEGGRRDVPGATYDFDGWEPWADGEHGGIMHGGRHRTYESALAWLEHYAAHRLERAA